MTIEITGPETEALIRERLRSGRFKDAEDVILRALQASGQPRAGVEREREAAIERLKSFGRKHGLSLQGMTIRELRHEARP